MNGINFLQKSNAPDFAKSGQWDQLEGVRYEALQKEILDGTLEIVWKQGLLQPIQMRFMGGHLVPLQMPAMRHDYKAEEIRSLLSRDNHFLAHQVTELDLRALHLITIPAEVGLLANLTKLHLCYNRIKKIENLEGLARLEVLELNDNQIEKIGNLKWFTRLEVLELNNNLITDLEHVEFPTQLQVVELNNNRITRIENLKPLTQLQVLELNNNRITKIENLEGQTRLKILYLSVNLITKIENLGELKQLKVLGLNNNRIRKIENLEGQTQLKRLGLTFNQIVIIHNFNGLQQLEQLFLNNNPIEAEIENLHNHLPRLQRFNGLPFRRATQQVSRKRKQDINGN